MNKTARRIFILGILFISLSGCTSINANKESNIDTNSDYFEIIREIGKNVREVRDPETGVHYYMQSWGSSASITPYFINKNTVKVTNQEDK